MEQPKPSSMIMSGAESDGEADVDSVSLVGSEVSGSSAAGSGTKMNQRSPAIAAEENKYVKRLRLMVITMMLASTIGVAFAVFRYVTHTEQKSFESSFDDDSDKVLESIGSALDQTLGAVDNYLTGLVSFARYTNATWPFVTLPDYAVRMAKLRSLSKAILVTQYHYVTGDERADWEAYSVENDAWVEAGIDNQKVRARRGNAEENEIQLARKASEIS